jgi:lysophospholipase L1-like esterase
VATASASAEPALALRAAEPASAAPAKASAPAPAPSPAPSAERRAYTVAVIGDSLTDASSGGGKYVAYLKKRCPASRFDNYGKGGDMVNQMRKRFFRDVIPVVDKVRYTHLIVFGGVNDLYSDLTAGRTPEKVGNDLNAMYRAAKEHQISVVAVTVAPWGDFKQYYNERRGRATRELNDWMKKQQAEHAVDAVIDAYALLSCGDAERLCPAVAAPYKDGLHFGPVGHEKLAAALYEQVFKGCR